jgi:hypothetical protein
MITPQIFTYLRDQETKDGLEISVIRFFKKHPEGTDDSAWLWVYHKIIQIYY